MVDLAILTSGINEIWVLVVSFLIFFMQAGFAMLEAGQVRAKNTANVLMKNMMDWSMGVLVYFLLGLGVAGIAAALTSPEIPFDVGEAFAYMNNPNQWVGWLFGAVFAMTAATIVSGAVAGRIKFKSYFIYSIGITGILYPVVQGISWTGGLISSTGYIGKMLGVGYWDFAGATVVHMVGGLAGLVAAYLLGPRRGRYEDDGSINPIPGHSLTLVTLGTLILAFGWYGFNVGTQAVVLSVSEAGNLVFNGTELGRVALNTTLGMGAGGVAAAAVTTFTKGKPDPLFAANGILAGLVAITGACFHITWIGGIILGLIGGAQVPIVYRYVVEKLRIDDVCGVFAVHGSAGAIGTFLIPVFKTTGFSLTQLFMQGIGIGIIAIWTIVMTTIIFKLADYLFGLRVSEEAERKGLDLHEHGVSAYPEFDRVEEGIKEEL